MRVSIVQPELWPGEDIGARRERIHRLVAECRGADLVVLPELWLPGYRELAERIALAEPLPGPGSELLGGWAREGGFFLLAGSVLERTPEGVYNTAVLLGPEGDLRGAARKMHLFSGDGSPEAILLRQGREPGLAGLPGTGLGMAVCYDLRFPESFRVRPPGPEVWAVPAAWPASRLSDWEILLRARAVERQAFFLGANAAGPYGGGSMVVDPRGRILVKAGEAEETIRAEISPQEARGWRESFPVWRDSHYDC